MTELQVVPEPATQGTDDTCDIVHMHCCEEEDLMLCGLDGREFPWGQAHEASCVACAEQHRHQRCPKHGRCVDARFSWVDQ